MEDEQKLYRIDGGEELFGCAMCALIASGAEAVIVSAEGTYWMCEEHTKEAEKNRIYPQSHKRS